VTLLNPSLENPAIMFALDRSQSMTKSLGSSGTRFGVTAAAITSVVKAYSMLVSFGYVEFPTGDSSSCTGMCCAAGFSPVSTSSSASTINAINGWLGTCVSNQSLTCNTNSDVVPTGQAMKKIANAFHNNTTNTLYALLLTDGPPTMNCPLDPAQPTDDACDQTANQIQAMFNGDFSIFPITTFVVGIGDIPPDPGSTINGCLNKMALAGGHPALASPFYSLASTDTAVDPLIDTFVTNAICAIDINDPAFDPNRPIEVDFKNMQMLQPDPINGWTLEKTRLIFNGSLCMTLIQGLKNASNPSRYVTANVIVKQCVDPSHPFQQPPP